MYDPYEVLAAIDRHRWGIVALCGFAMICNYTWFFAAVRQGLRDRVFPIPVFCIFFWLAGDASMVWRYQLWFTVFNHWYVKLFWAALLVTVCCELVFFWMILRFGRKELLPSWTQAQFSALMIAGFASTVVLWSFVKYLIGDDLYISYFHLANIVGPPFAASLMIRRRSTAGTTALIWIAYTLMVGSWFVACALWFGPPFDSALFISIYVLCTASAAAMALAVARAGRAAVARPEEQGALSTAQ
jgi:hypothetical protein